MLNISLNVVRNIENTLCDQYVESGGVLGARLLRNEPICVTEYYFDRTGIGSDHHYSPNTAQINNLLVNEWFPRGIFMVGIVHSHVNGVLVPSCGDLAYSERILKQLRYVDNFHLPIVTFFRGTFEIQSYEISLGNNSFNCNLEEISILP